MTLQQRRRLPVDSGRANRVAIAFIVFFTANALTNLIGVVTLSSFDQTKLFKYVAMALIMGVMFSFTLVLGKHKVRYITFLMIAIGLSKTLASESGDVSGASLIVTGLLFYITAHGISYIFVMLVSLASLIFITYVSSRDLLSATWLTNMGLYLGFAFYIRVVIYRVPVGKPKQFTEDQVYIIKQIATGAEGKQIYPDMGISLSTYNGIKKAIREITQTENDAHLIAWSKDNKII